MKIRTKKWSPMISSGKTEGDVPKKPGRRIRRGLQKVKKYKKQIAALVFIGALAWYISTFWCQLALIQGDSMNPAYHNGQLVILDKRRKDFQVGDVIAFQCDSPDGILIKRIAALPGDTVQIMDGTLYRNGSPDRSLVREQSIGYAGVAAEPVRLAEDEYFVLGDNLEYSKDSRYEEIGCVRQEVIVGKVIG